MKLFFAALALLVSFNVQAATGEAQEIQASKARIVLNGWVGGRWGLVFSGREFANVDGNLQLLDSSNKIVAEIPVHMNVHVWGLTNLLGVVINNVITIQNFNGKTIKQIVGDYSGISVGASVPVEIAAGSPAGGAGVRFWSTGNRDRVKLVDVAGIADLAWGLELMKVRVRLEATDYDVNHASKDVLLGFDTVVVR